MTIFLLHVFHRIGSLLPPEEVQPKFLKIYSLESFADETITRGGRDLNQESLRDLNEWFHHNNHYVRELKTAKDTEERKIVIRKDRLTEGEHEWRYNAQTVAEVTSSWTMNQRRIKISSFASKMTTSSVSQSCTQDMILCNTRCYSCMALMASRRCYSCMALMASRRCYSCMALMASTRCYSCMALMASTRCYSCMALMASTRCYSCMALMASRRCYSCMALMASTRCYSCMALMASRRCYSVWH